jgi:hypothetical protein
VEGADALAATDAGLRIETALGALRVPLAATIVDDQAVHLSALPQNRAASVIEIILPGGAIFARAEKVSDLVERREATRQVLINAGFAGFFEGYNPRTLSDTALEEKISDLPVLCFTPQGVGNGTFDPGGWAWIWGAC